MIAHVLSYTAPAAYALLPSRMQTPAATAFVLAIGLQETRFLERRQFGGGPGRGFWQFEPGSTSALAGILEHRASKALAADVLRALCYPPVAGPFAILGCHAALEHNDVLAFAFARLLLWTLPAALPGPEDVEVAWKQYLDAWRPGRPHRETWNAFYRDAWARVAAASSTRTPEQDPIP